VRDVRVAHGLSWRHIELLSTSAIEDIDEWSVRIGADPIDVSVMKELLEPSIDAVATLLVEEEEKLWSGDKPILRDCS
jgi:hypothetical protein